jgi:hypothetical protein
MIDLNQVPLKIQIQLIEHYKHIESECRTFVRNYSKMCPADSTVQDFLDYVYQSSFEYKAVAFLIFKNDVEYKEKIWLVIFDKINSLLNE